MAQSDNTDEFQDLDEIFNEFMGQNQTGKNHDIEETPSLSDNIEEDTTFNHNDLILQRIQSLTINETSTVNDDQNCEDDDRDLGCLRRKLGKGCGCTRNYMQQFRESSIYDHILNVCEMERDQKESYIMGSVGIKHLDKQQTKRGERKQYHCEFRFQGSNICREAFKVFYCVGEVVLRNIITHMKTDGNTPRSHGNIGKKPSHAFTFDDIERVVNFIRNYADENGMPLPAAPRGKDNIPSIFLPSSETKKSIHKAYEEVCLVHQHRAAKYRAFLDIWNKCCPHIKVSRPEEDVCGKCEKLRKEMKDARTEDDKLAAATSMQQHKMSVRKEKDVYRHCVIEAKNELAGVEFPTVPSLPMSRDLNHFHVTFDFAQGVSIPHHSRQIGALYFLSPRKVQIFGVRFDSFPLQLNYLIDEDQTFGENGGNVHGPNTVISLLDEALHNCSLGEKILKLHSDNCRGQNKNMYVMAYLAWRILCGLNKEINFMMQIAGHARCLIDGGFAHLKRQYRRSDVDTLGQLAEVVTKSAYSNKPVLFVNPENGSKNWQWRDWKSFLGQYFKSLRGISLYQHFRFSSDSPGTVFLKKGIDDQEISYRLLKGEVVDVPVHRPNPILPGGLTRERQIYLYRYVRPYVRSVYQDATCPAPTEE